MNTRLAILASVALLLTPLAYAQDNMDIDQKIKEALAAPPKTKAEREAIEKQQDAQLKEMQAATDKEEADQKAKDKAATQAALDAKGPTALPAWTPPVPQFTPAGPVTRKLIDGQPMMVLTGTSPLSPAALCDAWDTFKNPKFSHERTGSEMNHHADLFVMFRNGEDNVEVKMEADREPGAKLTHVTITSPLPLPPPNE